MEEQNLDIIESAPSVEMSVAEYKEQRKSESNSNTEVISTSKEKTNTDAEDGTEAEEYTPWKEEEEKKSETDETEEDEDVIVTDSDKKVPLHKLLKLKAQKKEKEAEVERYKSQLAEYERVIQKTLPKEEAEVVLDPFEKLIKELGPEPKSTDYDDWNTLKADQEKWKARMEEIREERLIHKTRESFQREISHAEAVRENEKQSAAFISKIDDASKKNPEIKSAIGWFEKEIIRKGGIEAIDHSVQKALVFDDNAPELIYRVIKDKNLVADIFNKADNISILKKIGKISAYIELESESEQDVEYNANAKPAKSKVVPRTVGGNSGGSKQASDKATTIEEYKKLRAQEDRNRSRR
jgi:hypothetical protein